MIVSSSKRRRHALRAQGRRWLAAGLCAAGFLTGQLLCGEEPVLLPTSTKALKPAAVQAVHEVPLVEARPLPLDGAAEAAAPLAVVRTANEAVLPQVVASTSIASGQPAPVVPSGEVHSQAALPQRLPAIIPIAAMANAPPASASGFTPASSAAGPIANPFFNPATSRVAKPQSVQPVQPPKRENDAANQTRLVPVVTSLPPILPASAMPRRPQSGAEQHISEQPAQKHVLGQEPETATPRTGGLPAQPATLKIELGVPQMIPATTFRPQATDAAEPGGSTLHVPAAPSRIENEPGESASAVPLRTAPSSAERTPATVSPPGDPSPLLPASQPEYHVSPLSTHRPAAAPAAIVPASPVVPMSRQSQVYPDRLRDSTVQPANYQPAKSQGGGVTVRNFQPPPVPAPEPAEPPQGLQPLVQVEPQFGVLPEGSPFEAIPESGSLKLRVRRSLLLRTKVDVYRTAIVDDTVCDVVQFTPREISIIGRALGQTHVTFWFDDAAMSPVTYLVEVAPDVEQVRKDEEKYKLLEDVINEMFPDSKVYLVIVADKLLVKGQAKDSEQAAQIMAIVRAQSGAPNNTYPGYGPLYGVAEGLATPVLSLAASGGNPGPSYQIINMLRVPGVQQVALKVKIAELNRTAARGFGVNVETSINVSDSVEGSQLFLASLLNATSAGGPALLASFSGDDVNIGVRYLQQRGVIRLLSEPTLVTLSGRPATFIAGGEFAVPTVVGAVGLNAVTTDFRAFGAIISFLPTVVDKDRIRLQVAPEFSQLNPDLSTSTGGGGSIPGLNVRAATTTVEMREGQTLAIAGLLEDSYSATNVGDLPFLAQVFGRRDTRRNETELIILVTPELVHAMEPEEVPPLPGFDVTEPTAARFFLHGDIEGDPTRDYRSTVWPRLRKRYGMGGSAMTSGPFGHGQ